MIGFPGLFGDEGAEAALRCSRAGCTQDATTTVNWRNPKIHAADRVKVWLACDDHVHFLREFLSARNFPVQTAPLGVVVDRLADLPAPSSAPAPGSR